MYTNTLGNWIDGGFWIVIVVWVGLDYIGASASSKIENVYLVCPFP